MLASLASLGFLAQLAWPWACGYVGAVGARLAVSLVHLAEFGTYVHFPRKARRVYKNSASPSFLPILQLTPLLLFDHFVRPLRPLRPRLCYCRRLPLSQVSRLIATLPPPNLNDPNYFILTPCSSSLPLLSSRASLPPLPAPRVCRSSKTARTLALSPGPLTVSALSLRSRQTA